MIIPMILMLSVVFVASESPEPLIPDGINQILGSIQPNMSEAQVWEIVTALYPDAVSRLGVWSGQTGYADFELTPRYTVSISEYNDPVNFELRFVHPDMVFYVYDYELNQRIDISFYRWEGVD
jgi:hypothetical protein